MPRVLSEWFDYYRHFCRREIRNESRRNCRSTRNVITRRIRRTRTTAYIIIIISVVKRNRTFDDDDSLEKVDKMFKIQRLLSDGVNFSIRFRFVVYLTRHSRRRYCTLLLYTRLPNGARGDRARCIFIYRSVESLCIPSLRYLVTVSRREEGKPS